METAQNHFTAFAGVRLLASGDIVEVVRAAKACVDTQTSERVALYDDASGRSIDIDYRGDVDAVLARLADHPMLTARQTQALKPRGPGRPKLGVVAREVTLLPRHWEWLSTQSGGASVTLRKLVERARRESQSADLARQAQEATHRFLWDMAGDLDNFEEITRAFYAGDDQRLFALAASWPADVLAFARRLIDKQRVLEQLAEATNSGQRPSA